MENKEGKKIYQSKGFLVAAIAIVVFIGAIAVANKDSKGLEKPVVSNTEGSEKPADGNVDSVEENSAEEEKEEDLKKEVEEVVSNENITEIDMLTDSESGKSEVFLQLKLDVEKANVETSNVENEVKAIAEKVQGIGNECQMEIVDSNMELVALYLEGSLEFKE